MRKRALRSLSIVAALILILALGWWYHSLSPEIWSKPAPNPIVVESPFIDEQKCAECHTEQAEDHRTSGHANTFHLTNDSETARWLSGKTFDDPERPYSYVYHFDDRTGLSVSIPKQFGEDHFQLQYVLGSGHNALTFLSLMPDRLGDTTGIEHRVSLYRSGQDWELDLTPGHRLQLPGQTVEHFGKVLRGDKLNSCVHCHTTQGEIVRQQIEDLSPHVGCQSCHGSGRDHVMAVENDSKNAYAGFTEQSAREEVEMCGRCHRLAHDDASEVLSPDDIRLVRFQSIGVLQTRCFTESGEELRCTTCHDPHRTVSRDKAHYVTRCLSCHGEQDSTPCPVSPQTNCIECHMPAIDVHRGIRFHDHWIRVRADITDEGTFE